MKIATIVGARPQFIKAAVLSRSLRALHGVREVLVHTGQHYDPAMSECFFTELSLPVPDYNLAISCSSHAAQTGRMMEAIEHVLMTERPDWVLVYGDTNSTLAGAVAAAKLHLPLAHVEAGLRSFDRWQPEEINRVLTDHISTLLFAPTKQAIVNLRDEGIGDNAHLSGDVMYDAALFFGPRAEQHSRVLEQLRLSGKEYVLATVHRAENTDDVKRLHTIMDGLAQLSRDIPVVLPLHPRTRKAMEREGMLDGLVGRRLQLIRPVGYLDMVMLEKHARLIATDSGGVQKEAFFHRVQCVTLRETTEWVELVEMGWNRLAPPTSLDNMVSTLRCALLAAPPLAHDPYGGGVAGEHIARVLSEQAENGQLTLGYKKPHKQHAYESSGIVS